MQNDANNVMRLTHSFRHYMFLVLVSHFNNSNIRINIHHSRSPVITVIACNIAIPYTLYQRMK